MLSSNIKTHAQALVTLTLVLALVATCFLTGSAAVSAFPLSAVPVEFQGTIAFLQMVLNVPVVAFVVMFVRNLYGYYSVSLSQLAKDNIAATYSVTKAGKTIAIYLMIATASAATLPAPWSAVAVGLAFFVDVASSEVKRWLSS